MDPDSKADQRQYHDTTAAYSLPNDNVEHTRLEMQAKALEQLMSNKVFHAPVHQPTRILDVGCGTGRSTVQLAEKYPAAQVIGVDLSAVPELHPKPKNVKYVQGDVRKLIESGSDSFVAGSFDYVYSRLLSLGMTDWPEYLHQISSILTPGGWLEIQEMDIDNLNAEGRSIASDTPGFIAFHHLLRQRGLDPHIATRAAHLMRECGLVDVCEKPYEVPYHEEPDNPRTLMIAKLASKLPLSLRSLWYKLGEGVHTREDIDRMSQQMVEAFANFPQGSHTHFVVITGRKGG